MGTYNYVITDTAHNSIYSFYTNVSRKYKHTYSIEDMYRNINQVYDSINKIENGLLRRKPAMSRWANYHMANAGKWYFAYRMEGNTIYVEDACHAQNIHEQKELCEILEFMGRLNKIK